MSRIVPALFVLLCAVGCDGLTYSRPERPQEPQREYGTQFDSAKCGTISGTVTWVGDMPIVKPVTFAKLGANGLQTVELPNPNRPVIEAASRGVASAVVYLSGIDVSRAKPWSASHVSVELDDERIAFGNGERYGFVPVGGTVAYTSSRATISGIRARGAAYFTQMFPNDASTVSRTFPSPGRVQLTSASGQYWATGDLFVMDHPYYTTTNATGHFEFNDVPTGTYTLHCWHPNWQVARQERDPETGSVTRQKYADAVEQKQPVTVELKCTTVQFTLKNEQFPAK